MFSKSTDLHFLLKQHTPSSDLGNKLWVMVTPALEKLNIGAHLFDAYHDATLGDPDTSAFLKDANKGAFDAMHKTFRALHEAGLWQTRRNAILSDLGESALL